MQRKARRRNFELRIDKRFEDKWHGGNDRLLLRSFVRELLTNTEHGNIGDYNDERRRHEAVLLAGQIISYRLDPASTEHMVARSVQRGRAVYEFKGSMIAFGF